jgi:hypothetical protein
MRHSYVWRSARVSVALVLLAVGSVGAKGAAGVAADMNPKAIAIQLPAEIKWNKGRGSEQAILAGDPSKPGLYVVLQKWLPHNNSRPHFHPNDRFIHVVSGTWWVNTGSKYDFENAKPVPAGSFVTHFGKEIHYDGAKDEECVLEIVGMGPATSTNAEEK